MCRWLGVRTPAVVAAAADTGQYRPEAPLRVCASWTTTSHLFSDERAGQLLRDQTISYGYLRSSAVDRGSRIEVASFATRSTAVAASTQWKSRGKLVFDSRQLHRVSNQHLCSVSNAVFKVGTRHLFPGVFPSSLPYLYQQNPSFSFPLLFFAFPTLFPLRRGLWKGFAGVLLAPPAGEGDDICSHQTHSTGSKYTKNALVTY